MKQNCPTCKKLTDSESDAEFPFCCERCRLIDLGAWASEKYRINDPESPRVPDIDEESER